MADALSHHRSRGSGHSSAQSRDEQCSAPQSRKDKTKRSPNHVRSTPAKDCILSSMIASLDSPALEREHVPFGHDVAPKDMLSRSDSHRTSSTMSCPLVHSDHLQAADYPVIPTLRPPSPHLSARSALSRRSGRSNGRSTSERSTATLSTSEELQGDKDTDGINSTRLHDGRLGRPDRVAKPDHQRSLPHISMQDARHASRAHASRPTTRHLIGPSYKSETGRTCSTDAASLKRTSDENLHFAEDVSADEPNLGTWKPTSRKRLAVNAAPKKDSGKGKAVEHDHLPLRTPITNAIPPRTSSLGQAELRTLRKSSKTRVSRKTEQMYSPVLHIHSKTQHAAEQYNLDELGEDDQTVKRIKQLKLQREKRMRETLVSKDPDLSARPLPSLDYATPELSKSPPPAASNNVPPKLSANSLTPSRIGRDHVKNSGRLATSIGTTDKEPLKALPPVAGKSGSLQNASRDVLLSSTPRLLIPQSPFNHHEAHEPVAPDVLGSQSTNALSDGWREHVFQNRPVSAATTDSRILNGLDLKGIDIIRTDSVTFLPAPTTATAPSPGVKTKRSKSDWPKKRPRRKSMSDARNGRILEDYLGEEKERRNSVNDAVDAFLDHPRLSQTVNHPRTGRRICFSEVGDPNGAAVFVCVGMGLTRYVTAFYDELASTLRLRLITPDRPGIGGSEAYPERDQRGPLTWSEDVLAICQRLHITKFSILAHSAGAIYALAVALNLPRHVHGKVHLLAPWIPPSQFESDNDKCNPDAVPAGVLPRSQRLLRVLPVPFLRAANAGFLNANTTSMPAVPRRSSPTRSDRKSSTTSKLRKRPDPLHTDSLLNMDQVAPTLHNGRFAFPALPHGAGAAATDQPPTLVVSATATPTDPNFSLAADALNAVEHSSRSRMALYSSRLTSATWERATRDSNPAVDLLVCLERNREVGFRYVDVARGRPVVITHGSEDKRVPVENVRWLAQRMERERMKGEVGLGQGEGGCELTVLDGEGHGLMASAIVMGDALAEISGEWGWKRW